MKCKITLQRVHYMPKEFEAGILYVSEEFEVAGHLCPCGCGNKIITPLGPTDWEFVEEDGKATLDPSIGNWQIPCRSHYWITDGEIDWSYQWTDKQIKEGRRAEEKRNRTYFDKRNRKPKIQSALSRFVNWFRKK